ncbi:Hypothetical predicted protein [Mytilus galloprovincialis]|uniref:Mab-21-like HhH/H2TH-like domain-containing protein n=1 Tax=Mytilus galloprovincialis TaxID=29158 RepID=A0A8B6BGR5_MYTGA|nr:Hypothetical predicted protein [Mytilus galloprovincialis]
MEPDMDMSDNYEEEYFAKISEIVSLLLKSEGIFTRMEIDKARAPLYEMLMHHLHDTDVLSTGSTVEGSYLPGSDVDRMFIDQNMIVILDEKEEINSEKCTFLLNTKQNQSCFVKLAFFNCLHESTLNEEVKEFLIEKEGVYFLSSEKYRNLKIIPESGNWLSSYASMSGFHEHGPCSSSSVNFDISCRSTDLDTTEGIQCSKWPMVALEWTSRERNSIWPPKHLIDKARDLPVHVVPVGDPTSDECQLQWRFSFSYVERELVWSFNESQLYTFVLLKTIFKAFLEPVTKDILSTYHLKTIIFWVSEEGLIKLQESNLIRVLKRCLQMLKECISRRTLKHFILSNHNLFYHKFENSDLRESIVNMIDCILSDIISVLQHCRLPLENVKLRKFEKSVIVSEGNPPSLTKLSEVLIELSQGSDECIRNKNKFSKYGAAFGIMISMVRGYVEGSKLTELLDIFDQSVSKLNVEIIFALKIFSIIRLGILYHLDYINIMDPSPLYFEGGIFKSEFIDSSNLEEKHIRLNAARSSFDLGCSLDQLSGRLYQAMFLLVQNDLTEMLEGIAKIFEKSLILKYEGFCCSSKNVKISDGEISITNDVPDICDENIPGSVCYDVILTGHDVRCVPEAVKFECELNDYDKASFYFLYHPAVYYYFLAFQLHQRLNDKKNKFKALGQLEHITKIVKNENDGHRALNLLGYCFSEVGDEEKAFATFRLSLQMKNSAYNAAAYHLCLMVMKHIPETYLYLRNV